MKIKPATEGLLVKDPIDGRPLAADGEEKPRSTYWLRCLMDGSAVECEDAPKRRRRAAPRTEPEG